MTTQAPCLPQRAGIFIQGQRLRLLLILAAAADRRGELGPQPRRDEAGAACQRLR